MIVVFPDHIHFLIEMFIYELALVTNQYVLFAFTFVHTVYYCDVHVQKYKSGSMNSFFILYFALVSKKSVKYKL